jgi:hypothetical protein
VTEAENPETKEGPKIAIPFRISQQTTVTTVKYALIVGAIFAMVALAKLFRVDIVAAFWGTAITLVLMMVLAVVAKAASRPMRELHAPTVTLVWFSMILFMGTTTALFTSAFFDFPVPLKPAIFPINARVDSLSQYYAGMAYQAGLDRSNKRTSEDLWATIGLISALSALSALSAQ